MDLSLTDEQELIKVTSRDFLKREYPKRTLLELDLGDTGITQDLWNKAAGMGWLGMLIPPQFGGSGNSLTDVAVLFEELGQGPIPGPYFSSGVLGALSILEAGSQQQQEEILPRIAQGEWILSLAVTEPNYGWNSDNIKLTLSKEKGNYRLTGTKLFVQDALSATHLVCPVRMDGSKDVGRDLRLVILDSSQPGIKIKKLNGFMTSMAEVTFDKVEIPKDSFLEGGWQALQRAFDKAIPVLSAYQVGGSQAVFNMSVEYSSVRVQFGRPIGRFQHVQDHIIRLINHLDSARWTTYEALWKLDSGFDASASVHMSKAVASEAYVKSCDAAHEVHAGIGIDREYGLSLHTQMSRTLYSYLGDPKFHKTKLGDAIGL